MPWLSLCPRNGMHLCQTCVSGHGQLSAYIIAFVCLFRMANSQWLAPMMGDAFSTVRISSNITPWFTCDRPEAKTHRDEKWQASNPCLGKIRYVEVWLKTYIYLRGSREYGNVVYSVSHWFLIHNSIALFNHTFVHWLCTTTHFKLWMTFSIEIFRSAAWQSCRLQIILLLCFLF